MSLYGTGRAAGVTAACAAGAATAAAHAAAGWHLAPAIAAEPTSTTAVAGAVGAGLAYRMLRAQGRSRYAAFLCGAAYGMSPLFAGLHGAAREQLAAALAPLALEAAARLQRPGRRDAWRPWFGVCLAVVFAGGATVVGGLAAALALCMVAVTAVRERSATSLRACWIGALALVGGLAAAANFVALDPLAAALGPARAPDVAAALAAETAAMTLARVVGPFLVWFALFGVLRRQQNVNTTTWALLALVGAAPIARLALPGALTSAPDAVCGWAVPAASWWLSVLAITVMGAAGLDDWLDQPLRRRGAHLWLLVTTLTVAPALPLAGASLDASHVAIGVGTLTALAGVTLAWRRLGVPRFKNVLAAVGLTAFALPLLWQQPDAAPLAAPLAEVSERSLWDAWRAVARAPWSSFTGFTGALAAGLVGAAALRRRVR